MKKMLFIFNPNSGKGKIKNELLKIVQTFSEADYEVTVYPTRAPMDGYQHIIDNEGKFDIVVCSGGDGTLNETVGAILKYKGEKPPIGYIPSGTTNDFAASLNIPKNMVTAAKHIALGKPFQCDIGLVNNIRSFNYVAAFGAFTEVSYETPQNLKNVLGHQAYVLEGVKAMASVKPRYFRVYSNDDLITQGNYVYGMISNTNYVGGIKNIAGNRVDLQDGLFEVTLVKELSNPVAVQSIVSAFLTQNFENCDWIERFKVSSVEFETAEEVKWTFDGEYGGNHKQIRFDVLKRAVTFIVKGRSSLIVI